MDNTKGFKAFTPGLVCKGKQYAENTDFEEAGGDICGKGMMHYCVNPFDCLDYYPLIGANGETSDFAAVEALEPPVTDDGRKFATKKLHIGLRLGLPGFVKACVDFMKVQTIDNIPKSDFDIGSSGYDAKIGSSGNDAKIGSSGNDAKIGSSGDDAQIGSSGNAAKIGSSGNAAQIESTGEDSVICCAGHSSKVKAKIGSWVTLSEWKYSDKKERFVPICVKTEFVDGVRIKPDTWYELVAGEFREVAGVYNAHRIIKRRYDVAVFRGVTQCVRHRGIFVKLCPLRIDKNHLHLVWMVAQDSAHQPIKQNGFTGAGRASN